MLAKTVKNVFAFDVCLMNMRILSLHTLQSIITAKVKDRLSSQIFRIVNEFTSNKNKSLHLGLVFFLFIWASFHWLYTPIPLFLRY